MESEKITVRLPTAQVRAIDTFIKFGEFASRSEAIRRALSMLIEDTAERIYEKSDLWKKVQELEAMMERTESLRKK
ncbi:MAG: ribbon-helix-helix protein, CopG family [Thermoplasmata archaeon]|nr:MAG: ribbon-helix-helix protein, CopG family [Thermoplasmata archaeon]MCD6171835.1 ribbon-helix-helix protein, CopG family [Thermoplasmata archaeon]